MTIKLEPIPSAAARCMSDGQLELARTADRLATERFFGRAAGYDEAAQFPSENYDDLREAGLTALRVPTEYGGREADPLTYAMCILAVARGCPSTA